MSRAHFLIGASLLMNALLVTLAIHGPKTSANYQDENEPQVRPSFKGMREQRAHRAQLKEKIGEREGQLGYGDVGDTWIELPLAAAVKLIGMDWLRAFPEGKISGATQALLAINPAELEQIEAANLELIEEIKAHETESAIVRSLDTQLTSFEIPGDKEFGKASRARLATVLEEILGSERGAVLTMLLLWENPFYPSPGDGPEVIIQRVDSAAKYSEIYTAYESEDSTLDRTLRRFNLNQLQDRYGHIADLSAWGDFLYDENVENPASAAELAEWKADPLRSSPSFVDRVPSLLDYKPKKKDSLGFEPGNLWK